MRGVDMRRSVGALVLMLNTALMVAGCGDDHSGSASSSTLVFAPEGEDLNVYDAASGAKQVLISGNEDESRPDIPAVNGEVCFDPTHKGRFAIADDRTQPNPPPHWTIMQLHGSRIGELAYDELGRVTPTFQGDNDDPVGCAYMRDGRLLTTDIGSDRLGPSNGQLSMWFTPVGEGTPHYCKLDIEIGTAGAVLVDAQDRIYVASARNNPGIYRYSPPYPTSDTADGGCGGTDHTGAPLVDTIRKELFTAGIATPNAIVASPHGTFYVSSIVSGMIGEFDADGHLIRRVLQPPAGEHLGPLPFSTGSPFGLGIDSDGTLYYSDLGLIIGPGGIGPGHRLGTVRRITFVDGEPQPPETLDSGLNFPDGIGVFEP